MIDEIFLCYCNSITSASLRPFLVQLDFSQINELLYSWTLFGQAFLFKAILVACWIYRLLFQIKNIQFFFLLFFYSHVAFFPISRPFKYTKPFWKYFFSAIVHYYPWLYFSTLPQCFRCLLSFSIFILLKYCSQIFFSVQPSVFQNHSAYF